LRAICYRMMASVNLSFAILALYSIIMASNTRALDLNLPGNLDRICGFKIESIDELYGISIEKRE
jgi:hypothetical protein